MREQRATCPYCGKLSLKMYALGVERQREQVKCTECGKYYSVVFGSGDVKSERIIR